MLLALLTLRKSSCFNAHKYSISFSSTRAISIIRLRYVDVRSSPRVHWIYIYIFSRPRHSRVRSNNTRMILHILHNIYYSSFSTIHIRAVCRLSCYETIYYCCQYQGHNSLFLTYLSPTIRRVMHFKNYFAFFIHGFEFLSRPELSHYFLINSLYLFNP